MRKIIFAAGVLLLGSFVSFGATIASVQSGDWNSISTWDCGCIPGASDDVTIMHDVTINASVSVNSLTFGEAYYPNPDVGTLVVSNNSTLTIATGETNLNRSGNSLTIDEGSSIIKTLGDFKISAQATVAINGELDVQGGDFTVSGGDNSSLSVGVNGVLKTSGNFTYAHSNQTINILGNVTVGSMTAGGGNGTTFNLASGSNFTIINTLTITTTQSFLVNGEFNIGSVSVTGGSPEFEIGAGGSMNVAGNFNLSSSGGLNISSASGTVNVGGDMNISGGATAEVDGSLNIDGKLTIDNSGNRITGTGTVSATTAECPDDDCGIGTEEEVTLPVELYSFDVSAEISSVKISWVTSSEINNDYFNLYRSANGKDFELIHSVLGAGTTTEQQFYQSVDYPEIAGVYYYQLEQVDYDGQNEFFDIEKVEFKMDELGSVIYPVPLSSGENFYMNYPQTNEVVYAQIFDLSGQLKRQLQVEQGQNKITFQSSALNLSAGIYMVNIQIGNTILNKKIKVE